MGDNLGFLLPAWLLLAPLMLAIADMLNTSRLAHASHAETKPVVARPTATTVQQAP